MPALAGCHLFSNATIECTQGELPECADVEADADTDADTDADADSDADGDTDLQPVTGGAYLGATQAGGFVVKAFAATGEALLSVSSSGDMNGPIGFDAESEEALVANGNAVFLVVARSITPVGELDGPAVDIAVGDGQFFVASPTQLYVVDEGQLTRLTMPNTPNRLTSLWMDSEAILYILDDGGSTNSPSLYSYDTLHSTFASEFAQYDTTSGRSVDGFEGPEGLPFVCSAAGGVYSVADIASGTSDWERLATGSFNDVVDCAYDPGSDEVLIFSNSRGVWRVGAIGGTEEFLPITDVARLVRGNSF